MKSKKWIAGFLTCIMTVGLLTGCGTAGGSQSASTEESDTESVSGTENADENETVSETENKEAGTEAETAPETITEETQTTAEDEKVLVVYYSATGNTKDVAEQIAQITGGDLFEIEPTQPYTDDDLNWTKDDSRVTKEHEDESLRDVELVSTTVDGWDSYDTVYIGYPIWWGIAAWPVDNFVKANDFTGKTVIPFCTTASSGIGDSGKLLEEMTGTGDWKDGERFKGGASESDIRSWIDGLGL